MSLSTTSLDLYFVFILIVSAENAVSHKYVIANGNKMFTALLDNSEYSVDTLSQKADKELSEFDHTKVLLALPARGPPSHSLQRQKDLRIQSKFSILSFVKYSSKC